MTPLSLRILRAVVARFPAIVPHLKGRARWVVNAKRISFVDKKTLELIYGKWDKGLLSSVDRLYHVDIGYKSYEFFLSTLSRLVRSVYEGNLGGEFMDIMANLISGQLTDAYQQAVDDAGLSPDEVTEGMKQELDGFINSEYDHVDDFYRAIVDARVDETGLDGLLSRAETWANRWRDVYNAATHTINVEFGEKEIWELGQTEEHCETCAALDGICAFASEWEEAGFRPQSPPNDLLDCGGWKCDCKKTKTDQRRSPRALETLLNIAVSRKV